MLPFVLIYTAGAVSLRETFFGRAARGSFDPGAHFPYIAMMLVLLCFWLTRRWIASSHTKTRALS